jgi:hypothetical protein
VITPVLEYPCAGISHLPTGTSKHKTVFASRINAPSSGDTRYYMPPAPGNMSQTFAGVTAITARRSLLPRQSSFMLVGIKLIHTAIWTFLAACILALPVLAILCRFRWASIISVVVLIECAVLALNGGRCPLTNLAARYTADRAPNFDIYLPDWLAEHNKFIFGTIFLAGEVLLIASWRRQKRAASPQLPNRALYGVKPSDRSHGV